MNPSRPFPNTERTHEPAGQQGEDFFLIEDGVVSCTQAKSATDATEISLLTLGAGEYFGEMALMLEEPRAANCIATAGKVSACVRACVSFFSHFCIPFWVLFCCVPSDSFFSSLLLLACLRAGCGCYLVCPLTVR